MATIQIVLVLPVDVTAEKNDMICKEHMIHYYERFGFVNYKAADSAHGGAVWYDMKLIF